MLIPKLWNEIKGGFIYMKSQALVKRDYFSNWQKSFGKKYIPAANVIIIMDGETGDIDLRIGDGTTFIEDLPNILKTQTSTVKDEVLCL